MKDIKLKDKIVQGINDLFYIWKREFQTTFRDQGVLIFFILVPLGYPLLYSFIYDNEVVRLPYRIAKYMMSRISVLLWPEETT